MEKNKYVPAALKHKHNQSDGNTSVFVKVAKSSFDAIQYAVADAQTNAGIVMAKTIEKMITTKLRICNAIIQVKYNIFNKTISR